MLLLRPFADKDAAAQRLAAQAQAYQTASPFPHVVLDGLFDASVLRDVVEEIPVARDEAERRVHDQIQLQERKRALDDPTVFGPASLLLITALMSRPFLLQLEAMTGISGLIPDPYFRGGGFHEIARGGKLAIHADFNIHSIVKVRRRLNLLLYLNEGWDPDWGGQLELWDRDMSACRVRVDPVFNRMVVFNTDDDSYHGHPEPLRCPETVQRKSLALYYYTAAGAEAAPHSTLWRDRPDDKGVVAGAVAEIEAQREARREARRQAKLAAALNPQPERSAGLPAGIPEPPTSAD